MAKLSKQVGPSPNAIGVALPEAAQPTAADWTVEVAEYGVDDQTRVQKAKLRVIVPNKLANAVLYSIWSYKGDNPPASPHDFVDPVNFSVAQTGGTTMEWWVERNPDAAYTLQLVLVASAKQGVNVPTATSVVKSIVIQKAQPAGQITGFAVSVVTGTPGGVPSGKFNYQFTKPVNDPEYFHTKIDRIRCDASFTPIPGAQWEVIENEVEPRVQPSWWTLPDAAEYWMFRGRSVTRNLIENTAAMLTSNVTVPANPGVAGGVVPPQPQASGWSVALAEAGATVSGQPKYRVRITVTERPAGTKFFTAWKFKSATPPTDVSSWIPENNTPMSASGATYLDMWLDREPADYTLQFALTASADSYVIPASNAPTKSIVIPTAAAPAQLTSFAVSVVTDTVNGVPSGKFNYQFSRVLTDLEYFHTKIDRIRCDASFNPLAGAQWEVIENEVSPRVQPSWWSLPSTAEYWRFRGRTVSRAGIENTTGMPTANVTVPAAGPISGTIVVPPQLGASDWSWAAVEYGATVSGEPKVRIRLTINARPAGTTMFTSWLYRGASAPTDMGLFRAENNTPISASGSTYLDMWLTQEQASYALQVAVVPSGNSFEKPSASTPIKTVTIPALSPSNHGTALVVTVVTRTTGGVPEGRYNFAFTPPSDPNYFHMRFDRLACDSSYTPIPGANWDIGFNELVRPEDQTDTWWNLPPTTEYWRVRMVPVTRALIANETGAPQSWVAVPSSPGLDTSVTGLNLVYNPGFEEGTTGWSISTTAARTFDWTSGRGGTKGGLVHYGTSGATTDLRPVATSKLISHVAGDKYELSYWVAGVDGADGNVQCYVNWNKADGSYGGFALQNLQPASDGLWHKMSVVDTLPDLAAKFYVVLVIWGCTKGAWFLDDVAVTRQIKGTDVSSDALGPGISNQNGTIQRTTDNTDNLISNPGFEFGLKDWRGWGTLSVVGTPGYAPYSGSKCLKVQNTEQYGNGVWYGPIVVKPGEKYICEAWVVWEPGTQPYASSGMLLRVSGESDNPHSVNVIYDQWFGQPASTAWTKLVGTITIPSAGYLWVFPSWAGGTSGEIRYIDSVSLHRVFDSPRISEVNSGTLSNLAPGLSNATGQLKITALDMRLALNHDAEFETLGGTTFRLKEVDFKKAKPGTFSTEFDQEPGTNILRLKAVDADKMRTGVLEVGGAPIDGSRPRVSRFKVFDVANPPNLIGWIGSDEGNSNFVGAWFKRVLIGGTNPATAKIVADVNGNVQIDGSLIVGTLGANVIYGGALNLLLNNMRTKITNEAINGRFTGFACESTTSANLGTYIAPGWFKVGYLGNNSALIVNCVDLQGVEVKLHNNAGQENISLYGASGQATFGGTITCKGNLDLLGAPAGSGIVKCNVLDTLGFQFSNLVAWTSWSNPAYMVPVKNSSGAIIGRFLVFA